MNTSLVPHPGAPDRGDDVALPASADLRTWSIRELIAHLALTEATLRDRPSHASTAAVVGGQARLARELRRRRGRTGQRR